MIEYGYFDNGNRAYKKVISSQLSVVRYYIHDGVHVIAEYNELGEMQKEYTYSNNIDEVLLTENCKLKTINYLHQDGLNSVVAMTDNTGAVVQSYNYETFGDIKEENGILENAITYTGRWLEETGDYFYRARYYDAGSGRFLSLDPIGLQSGDWNFYRYVKNTPTIYLDPFGYECTNFKGSWGKVSLDYFNINSIYPTFPSELGSFGTFGPKIHLVDIRVRFSGTVSRQLNCSACCNGEIKNWEYNPNISLNNKSIKAFTIKKGPLNLAWSTIVGGLATSDYIGDSSSWKAVKYAKNYILQYALKKLKNPVSYCKLSAPN